MSQAIRIIAFAHRGEARAFLSSLELSPHPLKKNLFKNDHEGLYLLIAGEGQNQAIGELAQSLGILKALHPNKEVTAFNFGICGALAENISIGEVLRIRTVYSTSQGEGLEFKSFSPSPVEKDKTTIDLISSHERILDERKRDQLSNFAQLVDREGWGFAYAAFQAGVDIQLYKLVSDHANGEVCQIIKDQADQWSETLLKKFLSLESNHLPEKIDRELPSALEKLHITVSQRRRLTNLLRALDIKGTSNGLALEKCNLQEIMNSEVRPKEMTKELIARLHALVYPLNTALESQLDILVRPLSQSGVQVKFDQDLERELFHISGTITTPEQVDKLKHALENFSFVDFQRLLRGQDVQ